MKVAIAQIDMRLGDIDAICDRVAEQAALASRSGCRLLCVPAPLFNGTAPSGLVGNAAFERALVAGLEKLSSKLEPLGVHCLVPAAVAFEEAALMEVFLLKEGRVTPVRSLLAQQRMEMHIDPFAVPVVDVGSLRVAVGFGAPGEAGSVPRGCDMLLQFQVNGFTLGDPTTAGRLGAEAAGISKAVAQMGCWYALVAPVGGFEDRVFCGGSFVMDDTGSMVAAAPCFEEDLLCFDVSRGHAPAEQTPIVCAQPDWDGMLWEALRTHLLDTLSDRGMVNAVVPLTGDLPSSLLAALAVDALGPRRVVGALATHAQSDDPQVLAGEQTARSVAAGLGIRVFERACDTHEDELIGDDTIAKQRHFRTQAAVFAADVAYAKGGCLLSALTKTEAALAPVAALERGDALAPVAPFGDVWISELVRLAQARRAASAALPEHLCDDEAATQSLSRIASYAASGALSDACLIVRVRELLASLTPQEMDDALAAHVERDEDLEGMPLSGRAHAAAAVLLVLLGRAEAARRSLPLSPVVSSRPFTERLWPASLAWSETGEAARGSDTVAALVERERARIEAAGAEQGERMRGELMGLLGGIFGLTPEQAEGLTVSGEPPKAVMDELEDRFRQMFNASGGRGRPDNPFFSQN